VFTTVRDNQTAVRIMVFQGESERAEENELLGEFILSDLRQARRGEVEIDVTFEISADGIVSVSGQGPRDGPAAEHHGDRVQPSDRRRDEAHHPGE
jgi:molecular chaperone DnaK